MFPKDISKESINMLPIERFEGEIVLIEKKEEIRKALKELEKAKLIGLDTETRPAFEKGESYRVALIQLATEKKVFLIRLHHTGFSKSLINFLSNPAITKVGVGLEHDLRNLRKICPFEPAGFIDLSKTATSLGIKTPGLRSMAGMFLAIRLSKKEQRSNWERDALSPSQIVYAATDAWIALKLYHVLTHLEEEHKKSNHSAA